jgi:hypothetical protein
MNEKNAKGSCKICHKEVELARVEARVDSLEQRAEEIYKGQQRLLRKLDKLIPAVARLEVKAGVWGGVGGVLAALVVIALAVAVRM